MDRAGIFKQVTERNALRKAAQMPPLDVPREYARAVRREEVREYYEQRRALYGAEEDRFVAEALAEHVARFGHPPQNWIGRLGVQHQAETRFQAFLERRGIRRPCDFDEPTGVYGADKPPA